MDLSVLYVIVPMLLVFAGFLLWSKQRADKVLKAWTDRTGYHIVRTGGRPLFGSPVQYDPGARFSIEVEDREGHKRTGWFVWRNPIGRVSAADVWVVWDDQPLGNSGQSS